jgi:hypothetical protein
MTTKVLVTQLTVPTGTPVGPLTLQVTANNTVTIAATVSTDTHPFLLSLL